MSEVEITNGAAERMRAVADWMAENTICTYPSTISGGYVTFRGRDPEEAAQILRACEPDPHRLDCQDTVTFLTQVPGIGSVHVSVDRFVRTTSRVERDLSALRAVTS